MKEASSAKKYHYGWIFSALAAGITIVMSLLLIPNLFPTNDDTYAQQIMAGVVSPEPAGYITFINYGLCWAISRLFIILPGIPWWTIVHLMALFVAITVINRTAFIVIQSLKQLSSLWIPFLALVFIDVCLFGLFIARPQFTTTGSVLMAAAIFSSCVWVGLKDNIHLGILSGVVVPAILGALGYAFRANAGYLGFAFWVCAIIGITVSKYQGNFHSWIKAINRPVLALLGAVCISLCLFGIHTAAYASPQWQNELRLARALAAFTDYPRVPFEQDSDRYEAVGWDEDLLELAGNWYFMDERINTENLEHINEGNNTWAINLLENPTGTLESRLEELTKPVGMAYLALCTSLVLLLSFTGNNKYARYVSGGTGLLVVVLLGYLAVRGRLPERAELSVVIPAIACLASFVPRELAYHSAEREETSQQGMTTELSEQQLSALSVIGTIIVVSISLMLAKFSGAAGKLLSALVALLAIALLVKRILCTKRTAAHQGINMRFVGVVVGFLIVVCGAATFWQYGWLSKSHALAAEREQNISKYFAYVEEHPQTLFIQDYSSALTSQDPWRMDWPANQTGWGGWRYCYEWFDEAIKKAGFKGTPTCSDLLDDNVRFVSGSRDVDKTMEQYLENLYGPVEFQEELRLSRTQENGDIVVYKIVREEVAS